MGGEPQKWLYDFLNCVKIPKNRILFIQKPTRFARIFVPDLSMMARYKFSKEYAQTYEILAKGANEKCKNLPKFEKIFLTHKQWKKAGCECVGEEIFEAFFSLLDFHIIAPEKLPISEQISLLNNAKIVATTTGSTGHLALFCRPKTLFIMLTREYYEAILPQFLINQATQINWHIVRVDENFLHADHYMGPVNLKMTDDFFAFCGEILGKKALKIAKEFERKFDSINFIKAWAIYYQNPANYHRIANLTPFDFVSRLNKELLGVHLKAQDFPILLSEPKPTSCKIARFFKHKIIHNLIKKPLKFIYKKIIFNLFIKPVSWALRRIDKA